MRDLSSSDLSSTISESPKLTQGAGGGGITRAPCGGLGESGVAVMMMAVIMVIAVPVLED